MSVVINSFSTSSNVEDVIDLSSQPSDRHVLTSADRHVLTSTDRHVLTSADIVRYRLAISTWILTIFYAEVHSYTSLSISVSLLSPWLSLSPACLPVSFSLSVCLYLSLSLSISLSLSLYLSISLSLSLSFSRISIFFLPLICFPSSPLHLSLSFLLSYLTSIVNIETITLFSFYFTITNIEFFYSVSTAVVRPVNRCT